MARKGGKTAEARAKAKAEAIRAWREGYEALASKGYSILAICNKLKINRSTLYAEAEHDADLKDTLKRARELCAGYWEGFAADVAAGRATLGHGSTLVFVLKNLAGWRDKAEVDQTVTITLSKDAAEL